MAEVPHSSAEGSAASRDAPWKLWARETKRKEAARLRERVLEKAPGGRADAEVFLKDQFFDPLVGYRRRSYVSGISHVLLSLFIAAGGLATSVIVAAGGESTEAQVAIAVLGLLVGVLAAANQILQPGRRNAAYARAWIDLTTEGWAYIYDLKPYAKGNAEDLFRIFVSRVIELQRTAEAIAEPGNDPSAGSPAAG